MTTYILWWTGIQNVPLGILQVHCGQEGHGCNLFLNNLGSLGVFLLDWSTIKKKWVQSLWMGNNIGNFMEFKGLRKFLAFKSPEISPHSSAVSCIRQTEMWDILVIQQKWFRLFDHSQFKSNRMHGKTTRIFQFHTAMKLRKFYFLFTSTDYAESTLLFVHFSLFFLFLMGL